MPATFADSLPELDLSFDWQEIPAAPPCFSPSSLFEEVAESTAPMSDQSCQGTSSNLPTIKVESSELPQTPIVPKEEVVSEMERNIHPSNAADTRLEATQNKESHTFTRVDPSGQSSEGNMAAGVSSHSTGLDRSAIAEQLSHIVGAACYRASLQPAKGQARHTAAGQDPHMSLRTSGLSLTVPATSGSQRTTASHLADFEMSKKRQRDHTAGPPAGEDRVASTSYDQPMEAAYVVGQLILAVPSLSEPSSSSPNAASEEIPWRWEKYGQKMAKGGKHPRQYFRCSIRSCPARKTVEDKGDGTADIECRGEHDHPSPGAKGKGARDEQKLSQPKASAQTLPKELASPPQSPGSAPQATANEELSSESSMFAPPTYQEGPTAAGHVNDLLAMTSDPTTGVIPEQWIAESSLFQLPEDTSEGFLPATGTLPQDEALPDLLLPFLGTLRPPDSLYPTPRLGTDIAMPEAARSSTLGTLGSRLAIATDQECDWDIGAVVSSALEGGAGFYSLPTHHLLSPVLMSSNLDQMESINHPWRPAPLNLTDEVPPQGLGTATKSWESLASTDERESSSDISGSGPSSPLKRKEMSGEFSSEELSSPQDAQVKRHKEWDNTRTFKVKLEEQPPGDQGFKWRKYGEKVIKGQPYTRTYFRCSTKGCDVKKVKERCKDDPEFYFATYFGEHNHAPPITKARILPKGEKSIQGELGEGLRRVNSPSTSSLAGALAQLEVKSAPTSPTQGPEDETKLFSCFSPSDSCPEGHRTFLDQEADAEMEPGPFVGLPPLFDLDGL